MFNDSLLIGGIYVEKEVDSNDVGKQEIGNKIKVLDAFLKDHTSLMSIDFLNTIKAEKIDIDSLNAVETKALFNRILLNLERN